MKRKGVYLLIAAQALFLIGMAGLYYTIDIFGQEIRLQTKPIDPQDPFYGDYVTLSYQAEDINKNKWKLEDEPNYNQPVYVTFAPQEDGVYEVTKVTGDRPNTSDQVVVVKAKYNYDDLNTYHVDYGLNRYYVEDNTGTEIEEREQLIVTIAIAPWGQKKIVTIE
ncbi:GDYXXLXY domain-containing protein [Gracilibacillus caseinilyticus]|uniref:GDYXXLXY domain-containing protein n=1 Tax=Gracilibacillus caseinilyticus TaxID=2932256 RepID=A0ABY4ER38_9BACI|nr:GDYXXLXY domain-containing protein [Gracilibacillus caseinilyticus]UOQ46897.1 GDYXXLXY domain-containing protein [Gracilibacillus caseinilyticus]